ncbi:MAG: protein-tyrosine phosphatase family protein [Shimia sp.]|uniref:protein-tyrosine phosphatase family protein n=1 Tax=Shimia sp. TaxID=1954381 RepID=UPI0040586DF1
MGFEIVEYPLGGGVIALSPQPVIGANFVRLRCWAPDHVVSLTSTAEIRDIGQNAGEEGVLEQLSGGPWQWHHHVIQDFGVPDASFEAAWPGLASRLCTALRDGQRVLTHCRGGCGRSGMVVMALMVRLGATPAAALAEVRVRRPCAVETDAQRDWAAAAQAWGKQR